MSHSLPTKFKTAISLVLLIWLVFLADLFLPGEFYRFGVLPRTSEGLTGILFYPFIHGSLPHLLANTGPLFFLTLALFLFYGRIATRAILRITLGSGALMWLLAREHYHIGASGLIYGLAAFLVVSGFRVGNLKSIIVSLVVAVSYWSLVFGLLPVNNHISWEGHLLGAVAGIGAAISLNPRQETLNNNT